MTSRHPVRGDRGPPSIERRRWDGIGWTVPVIVACLMVAGLFNASLLKASGSSLTIGSVVLSLIDCTRRYGGQKAATCFVVAVLVAQCFEATSIHTGFPFGFYRHTAAFGPKLGAVPVILGPIYFGCCYIGWSLAATILRSDRSLLAVPIVAAFIAASLDLCGDALSATVSRAYIYAEGGGLYGVPVSNFLGWLLATWVILTGFALVLKTKHRVVVPTTSLQIPVFWALHAAFFIVGAVRLTPGLRVDAANVLWRVQDIQQASAVLAIHTILFVAILAGIMVIQDRTSARSSSL